MSHPHKNKNQHVPRSGGSVFRGGGRPFYRNRQESQHRKNNEVNRGAAQRSLREPERTHQHFPITPNQLKRFAGENADLSDIVKKFTEEDTGLKKFLEENLTNMDCIELVLLAVGNFCNKNGVAEFRNGFIRIVKVLGEMGIFRNIPNVIYQLPRSNALNVPPKDQRLKNLIKNVSYLAKEMLVCMPAESCDLLGENFFKDISGLQNVQSIRDLNVSDAFNDLNDGTERLQTAWEQHANKIVPQSHSNGSDSRGSQRSRDLELKSLMNPPIDFRRVSIMPKWADVCTEMEPFLRPNIINGKYPDVNYYLDVHFRLLLEDFFNPLRGGLVSYRKAIEGKSSKRGMRFDNIRLYEDVHILDQDSNTSNYTLQFSVKGMKKVNWEGSKRLLFGSLLFLSADNFNSFFLFTVADRKPDQLSRGIIKARFEEDSLPAFVKKKKLVMIESAVFFEAYRSVLQALQSISPDHFPMKEYILGHDMTPAPPQYLVRKEKSFYDLSVIPGSYKSSVKTSIPTRNQQHGVIQSAASQLISRVEILDSNEWPNPEMLGLDPSQSNALFAALTRKLVVIQGPPGTGKTYLGLKIVQALLHNRQYWVGSSKPAPILVICYTNHALDQFLEGIMKFTKKIVRVGGQSKCEALKRYGLYDWKKKAFAERKRPAKYMHWIIENRDKLDMQKMQLKACHQMLKTVETSSIVHEDTLLEFKIITKEVHIKLQALKADQTRSAFTGSSVLPFWLGLEDVKLLERLVNKLNKRKFVVQQKLSEPPNEKEEEDLPEEDVWDKEDVDAIQGERMQDDLDEVFQELRNNSRVKSRVRKPKLAYTSAHADIRLAHSSTTIGEKIQLLMKESAELEGEELERFQFNIASLKQQQQLIEKVLAVAVVDKNDLLSIQKLLEREDYQTFNYVQRWKLYSLWKSSVIEILEKETAGLEIACNSLASELKEIETVETAELIRNVDIIGITTTGAAKQRGLLEHLKSKIVVVEEAAEVLEAHIITSLSSSCQHLILIGDHQQLRPSTTVFKLAKDYRLDVSLFERLILNGMEPCVLRIQHRMRPEVSRLIVPAIYPELQDHESVHKYPAIPGMTETVFFLTHKQREMGDKSDHDSRSHLNPYEADLAVALTRHLLMQGFNSSQITILTTYSGQLLHFMKIRRKHSAFQGVRISVVDNFQGEENDIIILSLVRSNEEANIGFLKTENRICVALSRAKRGFYLIGNMDNLRSKSPLWNKICTVLLSNHQLGPSFQLECGVHQHMISQANQPSHFPPEGGCFLKCSTPMPCSHICSRICHVDDREHTEQRCHEPCTRSCSVGHPCPRKCFMDCYPCLTQVPKILPCSHTQSVECSKDPEEEYCLTKVVKELPNCSHTLEMDCGKLPSSVVCPNLCEMELDCSHICNLKCHKRSSHEEIRCRQRCRRTPCIEKHPCPKECFVECGKCMVEVTKKLPCGHEGQVKCWVLPKDAYCSVKVERTLPNCLHTAMFDCSQSTAGYRCTLPCQNLLCVDGHGCKKRCFEPCSPCNAQVERKLKCGHIVKTQCHLDPAKIKCRFPKSVVLPDCLHKVEIACSELPEEASCPVACDIRLECGHQCTGTCHIKTDPDHEQYVCTKICSRKKIGCKENHRCNNKCNESCESCRFIVRRELDCGHAQMVECSQSNEDIFCSEKVIKVIDECGHQIETMCSFKPTRKDCLFPCIRKLGCNLHLCRARCSEPCTSVCRELVPSNTQTSLCGHPMMISCAESQKTHAVSEKQLVSFLQDCLEPCRSSLACQHRCSGSCATCFNGRVHKACESNCGRTLVCGHSCKVNCAMSCPPCKAKCQYRCPQSKCNRRCCEPCSECAEMCAWSCVHYKCTLRCSEFCNRPRCDEPCSKRLKCQHLCVGLCGELCPPLCRVCNKEELTEFILSGNEENEDARFIYLEECQHTIEVDGMDQWMGMDQEDSNKEIQMKSCPRCKTIIRFSYRYGDIIKRNFQDIVQVKRMLFAGAGNPKQVSEKIYLQTVKALELNKQWSGELNHSVIRVLSLGLEAIKSSLTPRNVQEKMVYPSVPVNQRYLYEVQMDVIERVLNVMKNTPHVLPPSTNIARDRSEQVLTTALKMKPEFISDILDRVRRLIDSLLNRQQSSEREHHAFIAEVERLDFIRAYFMLQSHPTYRAAGNSTRLTKEKKELEDLLMRNIKKLTDREKVSVKTALQAIARLLNTGLAISEEEHRQIVQAIGLNQGNWYKCSCGHIYAVGECGMARQSSRCPECGAGIGSGSAATRAMV